MLNNLSKQLTVITLVAEALRKTPYVLRLTITPWKVAAWQYWLCLHVFRTDSLERACTISSSVLKNIQEIRNSQAFKYICLWRKKKIIPLVQGFYGGRMQYTAWKKVWKLWGFLSDVHVGASFEVSIKTSSWFVCLFLHPCQHDGVLKWERFSVLGAFFFWDIFLPT